MDEGARTKLELNVDRTLVASPEEAGLDVVGIAERAVNDALRANRRTPLSPEDIGAIQREIEWFDRYVEEHGSFADRWRRF